MARIRTIKPEFWQHPKTATADREARLLFIGLLNEADDEGRMRYSAKRLAGVLFPFDDDVTPVMLDGWVWQLERVALVERYEVEGASYLAIPGFTDHQRISHAKASMLPGKPRGTCAEEARNDAGARADDVYREGEGELEQGGGTADAAPPLNVDAQIRAHRWAAQVTPDEVAEAIFVLRTEKIPDCILLEALAGAEAFPSKWKTQARKLHLERRPVVHQRVHCPECGRSGMVINEQKLAVPCPTCRPAANGATPPREATA